MSAFTALFPSPIVAKLLSLLLTNPDEKFYQRSLADKISCSLAQVQYALDRIEASGLINKVKSGNRLYYSANVEHPAFNDLRQVFFKTIGLADLIKQHLSSFNSSIQFAFVFGSIAKGSDQADSDIDLLILSDSLPLKKLSGSIAILSEVLKREINPIIYNETTFLKRIEEKNRFALELKETPKIWLIGNENEFESKFK